MKISFKQSLAVLAVIIVAGGFLRLYKLDNQSFIADEYLGINIAYGQHQTGEWKFWDFNNEQLTDETYTRANIYHWQVARIFDYLEIGEFSARLASVMWGIIGLIMVFAISYWLFRNYWISIFSAAFLTVSISALTFDRKVRMYSMFAPVYLLLAYLLYEFLETKPAKGPSPIKKLSVATGLNWNYFLPLVIVGYISLNTHLLTVNIIPTVAIFCIVISVWKYMSERSWKNKYAIFSSLAIVGFLILSQVPQFKSSVDWSLHWTYITEVALDYSYAPLAAVIFLIGAGYLIKKDKKKGLWVTLAFIVPLALAIFTWNRNVGPQYIYFTEPFKTIIMSAGLYAISQFVADRFPRKHKNRLFVSTAVLAFMILVNIPFFYSRAGFYQDIRKWSYPNYRHTFDYYLNHRHPDDLLVTRKLTYYYIRGSRSSTLVYNENDRLTKEDIQEAQQKYPRIWFVVGNDNYIKGSAMDFVEKNFRLIETKYSNDTLQIWLWEKK